DYYRVAGGESGYIAPHPQHPNITYGGSYGGYLNRYDRETGVSADVRVWPDNPMGYSAEDIAERFQWTFPIVFSPHDPDVLYATSQHVWRTTNGGRSWERISP
ncbi:MAG: glycosyl hydrolase, partial [Gemmatimonadetes bacterium]|nr:glycosyl hydrolase [Gemmatimonadota bacterium]NIQ52076.1 glycosyl hydrolase [Gemmatimonadota bacterium]NIU72180.1 glycosyl hydrolase [Gammaproteobacteria bacterium]NIX42720.1 glycosyl hydrolase [Gemmatimonadota bacterium]NIY06886.1 glycosyl hydrolase [Gemmatimonadota bacterium]